MTRRTRRYSPDDEPEQPRQAPRTWSERNASDSPAREAGRFHVRPELEERLHKLRQTQRRPLRLFRDGWRLRLGDTWRPCDPWGRVEHDADDKRQDVSESERAKAAGEAEQARHAETEAEDAA